jgi:hypothetical protein
MLIKNIEKLEIESEFRVCYYYERKSGCIDDRKALLPQSAAATFFESLT